jgi:hypothetical protein
MLRRRHAARDHVTQGCSQRVQGSLQRDGGFGNAAAEGIQHSQRTAGGLIAIACRERRQRTRVRVAGCHRPEQQVDLLVDARRWPAEALTFT